MPYGVLTPFVRRFTAWLEDILGTETFVEQDYPDEHLWTSAALQRRLCSFVQEHPAAPAACLNLIGLETLKDHLGQQRWQAAASRVRMLAERMLLDLCGPDDLWFRYEEDHYIVVFAHLEKAEAQARCARFVARLNAMLLGTPDLSELAFATVLIDARSLAVEQVPLQSLMDEKSLASIVTEPEVSRTGVVATGHEGAVPAAPTIAVPAGALPAEAPPAAPARPIPSQPPQPQPAIEVRYEPVWHVRAGAVTTYLARAVRAGPGGLHGAGYDVLGDNRPDSIATLDALMLLEARAVLAELFDNRFRLFISVPVHLETLAQAGRRNAYMDLCRETPRHLMPFVLFWLHGLGPGVPAGRLGELVGMLKPFGRSVLAHLDLLHADPAPLLASGLAMVGMDLPLPLQTSARLPEVQRVLATFSRRGLHLYAGGIRHREAAVALARSGVDFLYGPSVGPLLAVPEHMLRFTEHDLQD